ncbi:MAG: tetratricopeptide repeat protein, partial [Alphaproteobacteria bacterium]|nr:tetratricopeptide repeat protein [Alphaproteobacteria bacterium]
MIKPLIVTLALFMFASVAAGQAEEASLSPAEMLAQARNMTTLQLFESGDTVATLVAAREAVQANVAQLGDGHEQTATARFNLAIVLSLTTAYEEAEQLHKQALAARRALPGGEEAVADSLLALGQMNRNRGHYADAEAQMLEALDLRMGLHAPKTFPVAQVHDELSRLYRVQDRFTEAEEHGLVALRTFEVNLGPSHPLVADRLRELALIHHNVRAYDKAESYYLRAYYIVEAAYGPEAVLTGRALGNLAALYRDKQDIERARTYYERSLTAKRAALGGTHPEVGVALRDLGRLELEAGDRATAEDLLNQAVTLLETALG